MRHKKFKLSAILLLGFGLMGLQGQTFNEFTDSRDGKVYKTVKIGEQVWMAENLAYKSTSGKYWAPDNDNANVETYGYLYDWEAACNACPDGWHLPSDAEWTTLTDYLGGSDVAGAKLKEAGTSHWLRPNKDATNETGFTALPGGYHDHLGAVKPIGSHGYWWSATEYNTEAAYFQYMHYSVSNVKKFFCNKEAALSVRCLRD